MTKSKMDRIKQIHSSLDDKAKWYLGDIPVSKYTIYANVKNDAYIVMDDYKGKYKDEHPYSGKIISIAAGPKSRGKGDTDYLIKQAQKDNKGSTLIAEIDTGNTRSENLFKRNGFVKIDE